MQILTIGHSTRTAREFLGLLRAHDIRQLADVRTVPRSARHPHFSRERLVPLLERSGIRYRHFPSLGGFRRPRPDSPNLAWRHPAFRGYADYMLTEPFHEAVDELCAFATPDRTVLMCAEALWWRCHRQLVADALVVRGIEVCHIESRHMVNSHTLNKFARVEGGRLIYPGLFADGT